MDRETFLTALIELREKCMGNPKKFEAAAGQLLLRAEREADEEGDHGGDHPDPDDQAPGQPHPYARQRPNPTTPPTRQDNGPEESPGVGNP